MPIKSDAFFRKVQKRLQEIESKIRSLQDELETLTSEREQYIHAKAVFEREMPTQLATAAKKAKTGKKKVTIADHIERVLLDSDGPLRTSTLAEKVTKSAGLTGKSIYTTIVKTLKRDVRFSSPGYGQWDLSSRHFNLTNEQVRGPDNGAIAG